MRRFAPLVLLAGLLPGTAGDARGDVVHLAGGGRLVGRVEEDGDRVRVVMDRGTMTVPRSRVLRIERAELPAEVVARLRRDLVPGDADAAAELARMAGAAGLGATRGELLELAREWAPADAALAAELRRFRIEERVPPPDPEAEARLLGALGPGARIHLTRHWRIAHDGPSATARRRGEMLEAAWRKFFGLADRLGLATEPPADRLEVLLYSDHAGWAAAAGEPGTLLTGMTGAYVGATGRVLLYDTGTSPAARQAREAAHQELAALDEVVRALDVQSRQIDALEAGLAERARPADERERERRAEVERWIAEAREGILESRREVAAHRARLSEFGTDLDRWYERENLATTTHEACHQLAYATGISRPGHPRWLVEGLATLFEVESRTSFVLEAPNPGRLEDLRALWAAGGGGDLVRIVTDGIFADPATPPEAGYAEAWALTHYLAFRRGAEFARYIRHAGPLPIGADAAAARVAEFRAVFGTDLGALERDWRAWVGRL